MQPLRCTTNLLVLTGGLLLVLAASLLLARRAPLAGAWLALLHEGEGVYSVDYLHLPTEYQFKAFSTPTYRNPRFQWAAGGERFFALLPTVFSPQPSTLLRDHDWFSLGWHGRGAALPITRSGLESATPSPTGRWLAWRSFNPALNAPTPRTVVLLSSDGQQVHYVELPPDITTVNEALRWSPDGRVLYILGYQDSNTSPNPVARIFQVEPPQTTPTPLLSVDNDVNTFVVTDDGVVYTMVAGLHIDRTTAATQHRPGTAPQRIFSSVGALAGLWRTPENGIMALEWRRSVGVVQFVALNGPGGPAYVNVLETNFPDLNWNAARDRIAQISFAGGQRAVSVLNARGDVLQRLPLSSSCNGGRSAVWLPGDAWVVVDEVLGGQCFYVALRLDGAARQPLAAVGNTSPQLRALSGPPLVVPNTQTVVLAGQDPVGRPTSLLIDLNSGDVQRRADAIVADVTPLPRALREPPQPWAAALGGVVGVGAGLWWQRRVARHTSHTSHTSHTKHL